MILLAFSIPSVMSKAHREGDRPSCGLRNSENLVHLPQNLSPRLSHLLRIQRRIKQHTTLHKITDASCVKEKPIRHTVHYKFLTFIHKRFQTASSSKQIINVAGYKFQIFIAQQYATMSLIQRSGPSSQTVCLHGYCWCTRLVGERRRNEWLIHLRTESWSDWIR